MTKRPRRSMIEYKKDVQKARLRRKIKELENMKLINEYGETHMKHRQNMLMGFIDRGVHDDVESANTYVGTSSQATGTLMLSIVIDENKNEKVEPTETQKGLMDNHLECGLDHRDYACVVTHSFTWETPS